MLKIAPLLKYLSAQKEPPTLLLAAFQNYLRSLYSGEDLLTPHHVQTFVYDALDYPHWQQNRSLFTKELIPELKRAADHFQTSFNFEEVEWPLDLQIIELQSTHHWSEVLGAYLHTQQPGQGQFRLVHDSKNQRMLAVTLSHDGLLSVRLFDRRFIIRHGALTPLREDLSLHYDSHLELRGLQPQKLEVGSHNLCHFIAERHSEGPARYLGGSTRGYLFQPLGLIETEHLEEVPRLFYSVKRVERFFTRRETDPFYQGLLRQLERAIKLGQLGDEISLNAGTDVLARAQAALDFVFDDDKLLMSLIREYQQVLAGHPQVGRLGKAVPATSNLLEDRLIEINSEINPKMVQTNLNKDSVKTENRDKKLAGPSAHAQEAREIGAIQWQTPHLNFQENSPQKTQKNTTTSQARNPQAPPRSKGPESDLTN